MNIQKLKVYNDGNHYIGVFPMMVENMEYVRGKDKFTDEQKENFNIFFKEARAADIKDSKIGSYIMERSYELDFSQWFTKDEVDELLERKYASIHNRKKRFERKIDFNLWNYFVTFTYDDKKQTEESFIKRLRKALSNLATRNGWRYIGVRERGSKSDRVHYHFIMYVPKNAMIGELFLDHRYSTKRVKMEHFTNNTYFQDNFGQTCWEAITPEDLQNGKVKRYLLKYITKSDERLIYSRHIPGEAELQIDIDKDVVLFFRQYAYKCILNERLFGLDSSVDMNEENMFIVDFQSFNEFIDLEQQLTIR